MAKSRVKKWQYTKSSFPSYLFLSTWKGGITIVARISRCWCVRPKLGSWSLNWDSPREVQKCLFDFSSVGCFKKHPSWQEEWSPRSPTNNCIWGCEKPVERHQAGTKFLKGCVCLFICVFLCIRSTKSMTSRMRIMFRINTVKYRHFKWQSGQIFSISLTTGINLLPFKF